MVLPQPASLMMVAEGTCTIGVVRLMMEDSMQFLVLRSLTAFADFVELHCMVELNIIDSGEVGAAALSLSQPTRLTGNSSPQVSLHITQAEKTPVSSYISRSESHLAIGGGRSVLYSSSRVRSVVRSRDIWRSGDLESYLTFLPFVS